MPIKVNQCHFAEALQSLRLKSEGPSDLFLSVEGATMYTPQPGVK
jgi:hypothetical protein